MARPDTLLQSLLDAPSTGSAGGMGAPPESAGDCRLANCRQQWRARGIRTGRGCCVGSDCIWPVAGVAGRSPQRAAHQRASEVNWAARAGRGINPGMPFRSPTALFTMIPLDPPRYPVTNSTPSFGDGVAAFRITDYLSTSCPRARPHRKAIRHPCLAPSACGRRCRSCVCMRAVCIRACARAVTAPT